MNALNTKLMYSVLVSTVTIMAMAWAVTPPLRELCFQVAGLALKPAWFAGKSRDPYGRSAWNRIRFYNYRRAYRGGHRGFRW